MQTIEFTANELRFLAGIVFSKITVEGLGAEVLLALQQKIAEAAKEVEK